MDVKTLYEEMPTYVGQMRSYAQDLNREVKDAYASIQNMRSSWYGKRYNALVKEFNKITAQMNELLKVVVGDIPYALETVANNYAKFDVVSNVVSAVNTEPDRITEIPESNEQGVGITISDVSEVKTSVSSNFKNVVSLMNTIQSSYNQIQWEAKSADAFNEKFNALKENVIKSFEDIEESFSKLMQQTLDDINATESANTVQ